MVEPGQEIELLAKTGGDVVRALADESGLLKPPKEFGEYVAMRLHYRYLPKLAERAMRAAQKIKQSGLPQHSYGEIPDPLLRAILVGAAEEEDPDLQEIWENLLANAFTAGSARVTKAFVRTLGELEPEEARQLDTYARKAEEGGGYQATAFKLLEAEVGLGGLDHLVGLGLLDYVYAAPTTLGFINVTRASITDVMFSAFGWEFVRACRPPAKAP